MRNSVRFFVAAAMMSLMSATAIAQSASTLSPQPLKNKETVTITFDPTLSPVNGKSEIKGVYYCWRNYHWQAFDMDLRDVGGKKQASFVMPDSTALLVWKFYDRDTIDVGGEGFGNACYVQTDDWRNMPSANIGWSFLRCPDTQDLAGIPSLEKGAYDRKDLEVVRMWINNELRSNPQELGNVFWLATKALSRDSLASVANMRRSLDVILSGDEQGLLKERELLQAYEIAKNTLNDTTLMRELGEKLHQRYPNGEYDREQAVRNLFKAKKDDSYAKQFEALIDRFPPEKFENAFVADDMFDHYYSDLFRIYIYNAIVQNKDYSRLNNYLAKSPKYNLMTYFWHIVQIPFERGDISASEIYPIATKIKNEYFSRPQSTKEMVWSPKEWREKQYNDNAYAWIDYAKILKGVGKEREALALCDTLSAAYGTKSADFNTLYSQLLANNGKQSEALNLIKAGVHDNAASPEMLEMLKTDYINNGGKAEKFESYVNGLKSQSLLNEQREKLIAQLIDEPTKLYAYDKLEGGRADMSKMAGKILVLDFWATWCGPCKAAMPGMQMAVDRYKNDDSVQFFFVSTMESDKQYVQKIRDFLKEKGYTFQVLLDEKNAQGKRQLGYETYSKQFHFSGIPMKLIIDGEGHVRWTSTGYSGSPTQLADEISMIVEHLKSKKKTLSQ